MVPLDLSPRDADFAEWEGEVRKVDMTLPGRRRTLGRDTAGGDDSAGHWTIGDARVGVGSRS